MGKKRYIWVESRAGRYKGYWIKRVMKKHVWSTGIGYGSGIGTGDFGFRISDFGYVIIDFMVISIELIERYMLPKATRGLPTHQVCIPPKKTEPPISPIPPLLHPHHLPSPPRAHLNASPSQPSTQSPSLRQNQSILSDQTSRCRQ